MDRSDESDEYSDDELDEYPDDADDASETVPCPACGADVYEDAEQCPRCGNYITHDTRVWTGRPLWWIILALLGILATILALTRLANGGPPTRNRSARESYGKPANDAMAIAGRVASSDSGAGNGGALRG